jgi:agmatinase
MYRPTSGMESPRFVGIRTFMRLPHVTDVSQCDAFIVGIPFDTGATYRVGARFAPEAIRSISAMIRAYHPFHGFDIFDRINVADAGDLVVVPGYAESSLTRVTGQLVAMLEQSQGGVPVVLGGDHTVVLPELRAQVAYRKQPIAVVHFDSHPDTWDEYWGEKYTHGTMYRRAIEEGLIDTAHSIQVGLHGTLYDEEDWDQSRTLGFETLTLRESLDLGMPATISRIRRACRRCAGLLLARHRCARSRVRARHRHAGGRRLHHDPDAGAAARPRRPELRRLRPGGGAAAVRRARPDDFAAGREPLLGAPGPRRPPQGITPRISTRHDERRR